MSAIPDAFDRFQDIQKDSLKIYTNIKGYISKVTANITVSYCYFVLPEIVPILENYYGETFTKKLRSREGKATNEIVEASFTTDYLQLQAGCANDNLVSI